LAVVEALQLKAGDEIELDVADTRHLGVAHKPGRDELLRRLRAFRGRLPANFKLDRDDANARYFFDTNVLVYLASADTAKADRAEAIVPAGGAISAQVLHELANIARRKMRLSWSDTHAFLNMVRDLLTVHPLAVEIHAGRDTLRSEDLRDRKALEEGVRIVDPFRASYATTGTTIACADLQ
jgi:predicted nucleic acid-binding protein/antitoxin component of MazEF toxin-antitoxin module